MRYFVCSQRLSLPDRPNVDLVIPGDVVGPVMTERLRRAGVDCLAGYWCDSIAAVAAVRDSIGTGRAYMTEHG